MSAMPRLARSTNVSGPLASSPADRFELAADDSAAAVHSPPDPSSYRYSISNAASPFAPAGSASSGTASILARANGRDTSTPARSLIRNRQIHAVGIRDQVDRRGIDGVALRKRESRRLVAEASLAVVARQRGVFAQQNQIQIVIVIEIHPHGFGEVSGGSFDGDFSNLPLLLRYSAAPASVRTQRSGSPSLS